MCSDPVFVKSHVLDSWPGIRPMYVFEKPEQIYRFELIIITINGLSLEEILIE